MKGSVCGCLVMALQIVWWVSATSRSFPSDTAIDAHQSGPVQSPETLSTPEQSSWEAEEMMMRMGWRRGVRKIGSSPPSCEHKCYGCTPCEPIQVPTTATRHAHFGVQYANYEPENWKCKCGPLFYSP